MDFRPTLYLLAFALTFRAAAGEQPRAEVLAQDTDDGASAEVLDSSYFDTVAARTSAQVVEPDHTTLDAAPQTKPRAVITADGEVFPGCWLLLDATTSTNTAGESGVLHFEWTQTAGPTLPLAPEQLTQEKLWLFLMRPGDYRIALRTGNEAQNWSAPVEVKFTVKPGRPLLSEREGRKLAGAGERVELPGTGWRQSAGPAVDMRESEGGVYFRPAESGLYIFETARTQNVPERRGVVVPLGPDKVHADRRPVAVLPRNLTVLARKTLLIDGSGSFDPDVEESQSLKPRWSTPDKQRGVELDSLPGMVARFTALRAGTYSLRLVVSDGKLDSEIETTFIDVTDENSASSQQPELGTEWVEPNDLAKDDIRYRRVNLRALNSNLDRAVQLFPSRCGAALRIDSEIAQPGQFEKIPISVEVVDGPLMHMIDWIARQTDTCYKRDGASAFWLARPLSWLRDEKLEPAVVLIDALYKDDDASDLLLPVRDFFKPILDARQNSSIAFEQTRQAIVALLPTSACRRLREIAAVLREPAGMGLPPLVYPSNSENRLRKLLRDKTVSFKQPRQRLDYSLRNFANTTGLAVGFDSRQFPAGLPYIEINLQDVPIREAVREVVENAGFDGCSVESPGGLWFYRGVQPCPSNEMIWQQARVQSYDLSLLLPRVTPLSGESIAYAVRKRVYPASWNDPGAVIFYHATTQKLLVIHGQDAQRKVLEFLYDLLERGDAALGPVEELKSK